MNHFEELRALDEQYGMQNYQRLPVAFVKGDGVQLWDTDGRRYLDFLSGISVVSLGHAHPEVAQSIADQAKLLCHISNLYYNDLAPRLAAQLDALIGGGGRIFFTNSGAEAVECAIKLARRYGQAHGGPECYEIISTYGSFHGRTLATLAATGQPQKHEAFQPLPRGFRYVEFGAIDALAAALDDRVAAVMVESIQGEGGVIPAPPGYLEAVRDLCTEREILMIVDEVQTGLGRTGDWFGFQAAGVRPDIVTLAKALGNGMPIGACWARDEVADAFQFGDHGSTFGGQPLAVSAALAVLKIMNDLDVPTLAARSGLLLTEALAALPGVASVRGRGLLLAAELDPDIAAATVATKCLENGLIVNAVTKSALRLAPPLLVSEDECTEAVEILGESIATVRSLADNGISP